jgi:hypothetical protein
MVARCAGTLRTWPAFALIGLILEIDLLKAAACLIHSFSSFP